MSGEDREDKGVELHIVEIRWDWRERIAPPTSPQIRSAEDLHGAGIAGSGEYAGAKTRNPRW